MKKRNTKIFKNVFNFIYNVIKTIFVGLYKVLKFIVVEISLLVKYFSVGLFRFFDFTITKLISLFSYIGYGLLIVGKYIGKFIYVLSKYIYKYFLRFICIEVYLLFKSISKGSVLTIKFCFYEFPVYLVGKLADFIEYLGKKFKTTIERVTTYFKELPKRIKDYFVKKWNNLAIVKHYRNKRDRELEVLFIDKFGKDAERSEKKQTYQFLARNSSGKLVKGYFSAFSKLDTHSYLLDEGYEVYEIKTNWWINFVHGESKYFQKNMRNKDLIFWLAQLSTYIKSGIPLTDAVKILAQQDKKKRYKKVYDSLTYELTMGESFSESLKKQGSIFPGLLINMVKAAELTGDLEDTLDEMSEYYSEKQQTRDALVSAMTYPIIILVFAIIAVSFILIVIIPEFVDIYESIDVEMNGLTLIVISASEWLKTNYIYLILFVIGVSIIYKLLYTNVKAFKTAMQYIFMHLPIVGNMIIYNEMSLFAKTFAVLNKNNVLLTDSIDLLSKLTNNEIYKMIMYDTISNLLRGDKMSLSFKDNWAVPEIAYYMITTGESTGQISEMLDKVSDFYKIQEVNISTKLKTFIEPFLIVVLAVVVGFILIAVIVPIFQMYNQLI